MWESDWDEREKHAVFEAFWITMMGDYGRRFIEDDIYEHYKKKAESLGLLPRNNGAQGLGLD